MELRTFAYADKICWYVIPGGGLMSVGENIRRYRKSRGMTQAQLAEAVGLTEGAVRHYESGIRAVKPELLESISAALVVSVNALKDYGVETASDLMSLLVRHRARSRRLWPLPEPQGAARAQSRDGDRAVGREARAARERRDRRRRVRGLESLAVAALRISQPAQPNQDAKLGGELRSHLSMLEFLLPIACKGIFGAPGE